MFFHRLTARQIKNQFTHYGLFYGCVPVYVNMNDSECPDLATRNWIPDWCLDAVDSIAGLFQALQCAINPDYQPMFAIKLTGLVNAS